MFSVNAAPMVGVQVAHRLHQATVEKRGTFVRRELAGPAVSCLIQPGPASKNASAPTNSSTAGAGFAQYRPLAQAELHFVLERRRHKLGQTPDPGDFAGARAVATVARITRRDFRIVDRLFTQVERVMKINEFSTTTDDVMEAARSTLVVGISWTAKPGCEKTAIPK